MSYNHIMSYTIDSELKEQALSLYLQGMSAQEIKDALKLPHNVRQIQRWAKAAGIVRTTGDAFRNAIIRNRVNFAYKKDKIPRHKLSPKIRFSILKRDNFTCVMCGKGVLQAAVLEVDHIDENKNNNIPSNLQTLCHECNQGKYLFFKSNTS